MITENPNLLQNESRFIGRTPHEKIVKYADKVPPLPQAVIKVLDLIEDSTADARRLADAMSVDPAMTAALLKLANSALFAQAGKVASVIQAVALVGFSKLRSLVLAKSLRGVLRRNAVDKLVWEHSIATAMISRKLAEAVEPEWAEELFTSGLLHRFGQFIMLANEETREAYPAILRRIRETGVDFVVAEREEIGFAHPLIGGLVANRWKLPPQTCDVILLYSNPIDGIETETDCKLALVKLSGLIADAARLGKPEGHPIELETIRQLASWLGITHPTLDVIPTLIAAAQEQFNAESHVWTT